MGVGSFQTWVTGSNSASHQVLEVIAVCRALGGQRNVLENSVFSIKALSTGAGTNWLPLLVVSAVKPKILSYPVCESLEWIHIVVAR